MLFNTVSHPSYGDVLPTAVGHFLCVAELSLGPAAPGVALWLISPVKVQNN